MDLKKLRKETRQKALWQHFKSKHSKQEPKDAYEKYILECIVNLGELYDDNQDEIRAMIRKGVDTNNARRLELHAREACLNKLGEVLRDAIAIRLA